METQDEAARPGGIYVLLWFGCWLVGADAEGIKFFPRIISRAKLLR